MSFFPVRLPEYKEQNLILHVLRAEHDLPFGAPPSDVYKLTSSQKLNEVVSLVRKDYRPHVENFSKWWSDTRYNNPECVGIKEASARVNRCVQGMLVPSSIMRPERQRYSIYLNLTLCGMRAPEAAYDLTFTKAVNTMMDHHKNGVELDIDGAAVVMFGESVPQSQALYTLVRSLQSLYDYWGACRVYERRRDKREPS